MNYPILLLLFLLQYIEHLIVIIRTYLKKRQGFQFLYWVKIIKIDRPNGNCTQCFIIEIEITPYVGAHVPVCKDRATIEL